MKEFALIAMENELEATEGLARNSDMTYTETEELTFIEKVLIGAGPLAASQVRMFWVKVAGTEEQFNKLVENLKLTRVF